MVQLVVDMTTGTSSGYELSMFQNLQVMGDSGERCFEKLGDVAHG
jgi:hypothetical protein